MASPTHALIALVGAPLTGDAYPHATTLIADLRAAGARDYTAQVAATAMNWRRGPMRWIALAARVARLAFGGAWSVARWRLGRGAPDIAYVPYPAVPTLLWLRCLPRSWRPRRVVADAFIGWYDTVVVDRHLLPRSGVAARLLRRMERAALRVADRVMVDTPANAAHLATQLELTPERFVAAPLALPDEGADDVPADRGEHWPVSVLFVGTFVPLHGVEYVGAAIARLASDPRLRFDIVGDGQTAPEFQRAIAGCMDRVRWHRGLLPMNEVRNRIREADICLGVFGSTDKAGRVWPLKNYLYAQHARAIVSSARCSLPVGPVVEPRASFLAVSPADITALADAILALAADAPRRAALGAAARAFYVQYLGPDAASAAVRAALADD